MDSRLGNSAPAPVAWQGKPCPYCGTPNVAWVSACVQCHATLPDALEAAQAQNAHIEYLLNQLPGWERRGMLSNSAYARLRSDYLLLHRQLADYALQLQQRESTSTLRARLPFLCLLPEQGETPEPTPPLRPHQAHRPRRLSGRWTCLASFPDCLHPLLLSPLLPLLLPLRRPMSRPLLLRLPLHRLHLSAKGYAGSSRNTLCRSFSPWRRCWFLRLCGVCWDGSGSATWRCACCPSCRLP